MPGPIAHVIYAEKIYPLLNRDFKLSDFRIGSLFPDIRTLRVIDGDKTHLSGVTFQDVALTEDGFASGVLLHSLMDELREAYVREHDIYADLPDSYLSTVALKICEDEELYNKFQHWDTVIEQLNTVLPQELAYEIERPAIVKWHGLHKDFLAHPPSNGVENFLLGINLTPVEVGDIVQLISKIDELKLVATYLNDFYGNLETLVVSTNSK